MYETIGLEPGIISYTILGLTFVFSKTIFVAFSSEFVRRQSDYSNIHTPVRNIVIEFKDVFVAADIYVSLFLFSQKACLCKPK